MTVPCPEKEREGAVTSHAALYLGRAGWGVRNICPGNQAEEASPSCLACLSRLRIQGPETEQGCRLRPQLKCRRENVGEEKETQLMSPPLEPRTANGNESDLGSHLNEK